MDTIEMKPIQAIEHRKPLRRYVVLAHEDGYWIALQGFRSLRRALRRANKLERWGVTDTARVIDSEDFEDPFFKDEGFPV